MDHSSSLESSQCQGFFSGQPAVLQGLGVVLQKHSSLLGDCAAKTQLARWGVAKSGYLRVPLDDATPIILGEWRGTRPAPPNAR
jgi:hypothetical protein